MAPIKKITCLVLLLIALSCANAQVSTGTTTIGANGGGSMLAPCTEILRFDNLSNTIAANTGGQNFVFILNNGDSLFFNLHTTGDPVDAVAAPCNSGTCFGRYGYTGLAGLPDIYQTQNIPNADSRLIFSNIVLKGKLGSVIPGFTIVVYDAETTGTWESITFLAPSPLVWNFYDSVATTTVSCSRPVASGVGTDSVTWVGSLPNGDQAESDDGFSIQSPSNFEIDLANNGSSAGLEGIAVGINRRITGISDTLCTGGNIIINPLNAPAGTTYTWGKPVVSPPGSVSGATAQATPVDSIKQTLVNNGPGVATVTYTVTPVSCNTPDSPFTTTVVIKGGGIALFSLGNDTSYCGAFTRILSTGVANTFWSTGVTASQITVNTPGTYWAKDSSACEISGDTIVLMQNPTPVVNLGNDTTLCAGQILILNASNANATYQWQNHNTEAVDTVTEAGVYSVTVALSVCTGSGSVSVAIDSLGPVMLQAHPTIICAGDSTQVCAPGGYASYQWNVGGSGTCVEAMEAGNYYVTLTDNHGCSVESQPKAIAVYPVPSISVVIEGDTFSSYGAVTYQWLLNGNPIQGATLPIYIASEAGLYSLEISDTNGCYETSQQFALTGINELTMEPVQVYPNPNSAGDWQLTVGSELIGSRVEVYDDAGQIVFQSEIGSPKSEIEVSGLPAGIYFLRIYSPNTIIVRKLVKL